MSAKIEKSSHSSAGGCCCRREETTFCTKVSRGVVVLGIVTNVVAVPLAAVLKAPLGPVLALNGLSAGALVISQVFMCIWQPRRRMEEVARDAELTSIKVDSEEKTLQGQIQGMRALVDTLKEQVTRQEKIDASQLEHFSELLERVAHETAALDAVRQSFESAKALSARWTLQTDEVGSRLEHLQTERLEEDIEALTTQVRGLRLESSAEPHSDELTQMLSKLQEQWKGLVTKFAQALQTISTEVTAQKVINQKLTEANASLVQTSPQVAELQRQVLALTAALKRIQENPEFVAFCKSRVPQ